MLFAIAGHGRSGTTLLREVCDAHPEIALTLELRCFLPDASRFKNYRRWIRAHARKRRGTVVPGVSAGGPSLRCTLRNMLYSARFLRSVHRHVRRAPDRRVSIAAVGHALRDLHPDCRAVGDKFPPYVQHLERLTRAGVVVLVLYRDGRDVVSSVLERARTTWSRAPWVQDINTAAKAARSWVAAIERMESQAGRVYPVRYEDLVADAPAVMAGIADVLGIDAGGFAVDRPHRNSVGLHRSGLTPEELQDVEEIAGPALARLGYAQAPSYS